MVNGDSAAEVAIRGGHRVPANEAEQIRLIL
jgi:hypothetical protein